MKLSVSRLKYFALKTFVLDNLEFAYLKWILNNLNHIKKLNIHLRNDEFSNTDEIIWNSTIDANFIYQYCLPDRKINLARFDFYISSKCESLRKNIDEIIHSFKIHPFFLIINGQM
ncbi:unnamed protein product [Rotaria sp. Silwood2]|nr:unnamed protein product [Rotaria sp. Silwood2]CAF2963814.1 unnamed protein product [Rotaria sp. Silwood2]CAF3236858.1 unnamed protein product [Rotaria sp. Silwood2]CAF3329830.1 unnamed protein product [Rotaria sp. Silwood2]CAF4088011.1 unnamed protein product [Rotaria sp. Silwood2]